MNMQVKIAAKTIIDNVLITLLDHVLVRDYEDLVQVLSAHVSLMKEEVGGIIDLDLGGSVRGGDGWVSGCCHARSPEGDEIYEKDS